MNIFVSDNAHYEEPDPQDSSLSLRSGDGDRFINIAEENPQQSKMSGSNTGGLKKVSSSQKPPGRPMDIYISLYKDI